MGSWFRSGGPLLVRRVILGTLVYPFPLLGLPLYCRAAMGCSTPGSAVGLGSVGTLAALALSSRLDLWREMNKFVAGGVLTRFVACWRRRKRTLGSAGTSSDLGDDERRERAAILALVAPAKTIVYPYGLTN